MYRLSRVKTARFVMSVVSVLSSAVALGACSSGITLFNNAGSAPYGQPGSMATGAIPTTLPMPPQPFVGNQLAAAQSAAQQRPFYVYQPAPAQYPGNGYAAARYAAHPQYAPAARKRVQRRPAPKKSYTVARRKVNQARIPIRVARAPVPSTGMQRVSTVSNQQGRVVIVRSGETLYSIARRHNVNIVNLKAANNIQGSTVNLGQRLFIPGAGSHHSVTAAPGAPFAPTRPTSGVTVAKFQNGQSR